jgi:hypothetical protein
LLRSIAEQKLLGFPTNLRVVMIDQHPESLLEEMDGATVLQTLLDADTQFTTLCDDIHELETALCDDNPQVGILKAKEIGLRQVKAALVSAQRIADYRSGARGMVARSKLLEAEQEYDKLSHEVQSLHLSDDANNDVEGDSEINPNDMLQAMYEEMNLVRLYLPREIGKLGLIE